jgi:putative heme-binding domain-containing protein
MQFLKVFLISMCFASAAFAGENTRQPMATAPEAIRIAKDFKVELLYNVPKDREGSWVSLCVDPKGRLITSDQYGGLYRITVPPIGGNAADTKVEKINVELGEAQGLLWAFDSLYVVVNKGAKFASGVYRVRDTNGDDQLDSVETLRTLEGAGEHGPHGIVLAPDGKSLYLVAGNGTKLTDAAVSRVPRIWSEDHLLPRMPDGRGFMKDVLGPGGSIYRIDPDGKNWELVASGFRNEYDLAFNREGDLFTYDSDMEWDMNTPWYRPTRVCLVASGADFGWRNGTGKWPPHYADTLPAVHNIGPGSPTGICFGYGAKFPVKYQNALFICDWSYGKLYALHLVPDGSSYKAEREEFAAGSPLQLTDILIHPDGAMYFTIGGRRTQSGLYRVTYVGNEPTAPAIAAVPGEAERAVRRSLEAFHGKQDPKAVDIAWKSLGDKDRFIRAAARVALEHQPAAEWQERALKESDAQSSLTALLALVHVSAHDVFHRKPTDTPPDATLQPKILSALDRQDWEKLTDSQRLEWLRVCGLTFTRLGPPDAATASKLIAKLDSHFPAQLRELNSMLCEMLIYLQAPSMAAKTTALLASAPTQEEQLEYAKSLRMLKAGWTLDQRKTYLNWFQRAASYRGGASFEKFVENIKIEAVANMPQDVRAELKPLIDAKAERKSPLEAFAALLGARAMVKEWTIDDLAPLVEKGLKGRDFARGRQMFGAVGCFACHRFDNDGGAVGPDLTGVAGRFSARDLLESIVTPSKEISDQYAASTIVKTDGTIITGRIINLAGDGYRTSGYSVSPNMLDPNEIVTVKASDVKSIKPSKMSPMPEGLLNRLNPDEILDLLAYLLSRGDRTNAMFAKP